MGTKRPSLKHQFWKLTNVMPGYAEIVTRDGESTIGVVMLKKLPIFDFKADEISYVERWFAFIESKYEPPYEVGRVTGYEKRKQAVNALIDAYLDMLREEKMNG